MHLTKRDAVLRYVLCRRNPGQAPFSFNVLLDFQERCEPVAFGKNVVGPTGFDDYLLRADGAIDG